MADQKTIKEAFERNQKAVELRPSAGKSTVTTKVSLYDGTTCEVEHKHWKFKVDIGKSEGGNDAGPGPGILERGALGSCLAIAYSQRAAVLEIPIDKIEVDVESEFDARGMLYLSDQSPGFDALRYKVYIESPASEKKIMQLIEDADDHSPVLDDFRRAIPVEREVNITSTEQEREDFDLWRIQKKDGSWEKPELLSVLNSASDDYQPSLTNKGIYFVSNREQGIGGQDVYYAAFNPDGNFKEPVLLGKEVNSEVSEISVFVNPDEEYMILSTANPLNGTIGNDDLYLLQNRNSKWSNPVNLSSKINSFVNEYGAFVSNDGQTLYYGSDINPPASVYKMDFKILFKELEVESEFW